MSAALERNDRRAIAAILCVSAGVIAFLVWLIYFQEGVPNYSSSYEMLHGVNALMNGLSTCAILTGLVAIKNRRIRIHAACQISAAICSTIFLVSYIVYHNVHGDTKFLGTGIVRPIYFFILISHISLTLPTVPLILTTFYFALTRNFQRHPKLARITWPLWLYVSTTGVAIFFLLRANS